MPVAMLLALAVGLLALSAYAVGKGLSLLRDLAVTAEPGRPAVLYFDGESCGPCLVQRRYLDQVQAEFGSRVAFETIDAGEEPRLAARFGVDAVPATLVVDESGAVRHMNYGLTSARKITQQLRKLGPS